MTLRSNSPYDYPLINPNFFSDPGNYDIERLYEAIELAINLTEARSYARVGAQLWNATVPACAQYQYRSREYWYCQIRQIGTHIHNPTGTCRMGTDRATSVVDGDLRVHGIRNLRVADASVFPTTLSGHASAPATMIAEKLSHQLKEQYCPYM